MTRDAVIAAFLRVHGFGEADVAPLAQDASFRRYLRISGGPRPAVLMDAPPPEDVRPFLRIQAHLAGIGLSVPAILAADPAAGLLLEEDLGDDLLSALIDAAGSDATQGLGAAGSVPLQTDGGPPRKGAASSAALFDAAVDALIPLQRASPPAGLPHWGPAEMRDTAFGTLFDWWWPARFGASAPDAARTDIAAALNAILQPLSKGPRCMVHRDFFAGNLLWLPDRAPPRNVGIIDFQGAAIGHPAYDLVSLVQDARRNIPSAIQERAVTRYLAARPDLDASAFRAAFAVCAAQRHLRVACQWVRLARRDHRPQYLAYGPRTWRLLDQAMGHPSVAPLAAALDRWIPPAARGNPSGERTA